MKPTLDERREQLRESALETTIPRIAFIGLTSGLLETLDDEGPLTSRDLAEHTDTDPEYVARWLDAAHGFEVVDGSDETFELTELGGAFLPDAPGTLMPLGIQAVLSARLADRLSELISSGEQPGESLLAEFENVTPWFGRMLEAKFRPYFQENILPALDVFENLDRADVRVLDLGCGNGWYLRELIDAHGDLTGVGVDTMAESIDDAAPSGSFWGVPRPKCCGRCRAPS